MERTASADELAPVLVVPIGLGCSEVWLRKNIETETDDDGQTVWVADEVHAVIPYQPKPEEIEEDFDLFWYELERGSMDFGKWRSDVDATLLEIMEVVVG